MVKPVLTYMVIRIDATEEALYSFYFPKKKTCETFIHKVKKILNTLNGVTLRADHHTYPHLIFTF